MGSFRTQLRLHDRKLSSETSTQVFAAYSTMRGSEPCAKPGSRLKRQCIAIREGLRHELGR